MYSTTTPESRSSARLALQNLRDGREFNPDLRMRYIAALCELTGDQAESVDLPARAAEVLGNRHQVRQLVDLLNESRTA